MTSSAPLLPPQVLASAPPAYPESQLASGEHPTVVLKLTVLATGELTDLSVEGSAGEAFDRAAREAVARWTFAPARRGAEAIASRVGVAVHFAVPELAQLESSSVMREPERASHASEPAVLAYGAQAKVAAELRAGLSDFQIQVGALRIIPRNNASDYLKLAPGILLTNEGGEGHAEQVFLRGFDARDGQDLEFSVDGVPINDSGNIHGNGYADTHFIIPELIQSLRVTEGPFSPTQGNYAVAGSADYHLGVSLRGVTSKLSYGSWDTRRALLSWAPAGEGASRTFAAVEASQSKGFGQNRASQRATAMGQVELALLHGARLRIGAQGYATHFQSAGVLRQDDVASGKLDFFATEDPRQGGDASRFSLSAQVEQDSESLRLQQSLFLIRRDLRLRENFTGFLLDTQGALDTLHPQRGDLLDSNFGAFTLGSRGAASWSTLWLGQKQALDVGYLARLDLTSSTQYRNRAPADIPYRIDVDLSAKLSNLGMFAEATLRPLRGVTLRGGARLETFTYNVLNECAAQGDFDNPSRTRPPINQSCHDQLPNGAHREPVQRSSTGAFKALPRINLVLGPWAGFQLAASYGQGVRSIDPVYISQDLKTPFASIRAYDAGLLFAHDLGGASVAARSIFFDTHVDRDLIFSQTAGRNVLANGTTRRGFVGALRVNGPGFDSSTSVTYARPRFDDTKLPIPYAPSLVLREDAALFASLPWRPWRRPIESTVGVGYTFVGRRALPYGQQSNLISVLDVSASLGCFGFSLTLSVSNLLGQRYRLGEYNYASDFHSQPEPTLVPARHFTAGAPRGVFLTLAKNWGAS